MRIKKVYIKNFKGIKEKKIIEFENQTSLLIGPNGFGKTTIFDILELCLTGKMDRTIQKSAVTKNTSDYKKPFYQNTANEEVVVKVWLEKVNESEVEDLIITKYLTKDNDGRINEKGRRNKPSDFDLLKTYRDNPERFEDNTFTPLEKNSIKQEQIDSFFDFESNGFEISEIYNLFNYLQQEETTFFLKKSEMERKNSLGFLFQTSNYEKQLTEITSILTKLNDIDLKLSKRIEEVQTSREIDKLEHHKIFSEKDIEFDRIDLFQNIEFHHSNELREKYNIEIDKISRFISVFSPNEFEKKQKIDLLNDKIDNNDLIEYYILQELLKKNNYESLKKERELLSNESILNIYILQKCILNYEEYRKINETYSSYEEYLSIKDFEIQLEDLKPFVNEIKPEMNNEYLSLIDHRNKLIATTNEIDLSINEIIRLRDSINKEFISSSDTIINDAECPYCGTSWGTSEELKKSFNKREETFKQLLNNQTDRLIEYEKNINDKFILPITKFMNKFMEQHEKLDDKIIDILEQNKKAEFDFADLKSFNSISGVIWDKPKTYDDLMESKRKMKKEIEDEIKVSIDVFVRLKELYHISLEADIKELEEVVSKEDINKFIIKDIKEKIHLDKLKVQSNLLKSYLETTKERYKYDHDRTYDIENFYTKYFDSQKDQFNKLNQSQLDAKKKYIESEFLLKQFLLFDVYIARREELKKVIGNIEQIKDIYSNTIKMHKKEMANNIKLPFYIYTAKILQNYQQGMGVFLSTKESSDSIRFLTDASTDHDAMHHLSSGQLAVISLAFSLAINKTYNISKNLKFLTIDDPVQEMDALNIHSFVELIRHEFLNEYQLIFSTHSDLNALYMKYKFEKINNQPVAMINVQTQLFSS